GVDAADSYNPEIHTELADKVPCGISHDPAISVTYFTWLNDHPEIRSRAENRGHMQIIGDNAQVGATHQRMCNSFCRSADVDEQGRTIRYQLHKPCRNALLLFAMQDLARLVVGIGDT